MMMLFEISKIAGSTVPRAIAALLPIKSQVLAKQVEYEALLVKCGWTAGEVAGIIAGLA
jgi:hypothetical protein